MNVIKNEHIVYVDVDDTLVLHNPPSGEYDHVDVKDPIGNRVIRLAIHLPMVRLLKEEFSRGSYIVVWSRGGYRWAENVVSALNLQDYVHQVQTKPLVYMDDKDISEWLTYRIYLSPNEKYKP
jgi:hypothetical protein